VWGVNELGALGLGDDSIVESPVHYTPRLLSRDVLLDRAAVQIAAGAHHSLALMSAFLFVKS